MCRIGRQPGVECRAIPGTHALLRQPLVVGVSGREGGEPGVERGGVQCAGHDPLGVGAVGLRALGGCPGQGHRGFGAPLRRRIARSTQPGRPRATTAGPRRSTATDRAGRVPGRRRARASCARRSPCRPRLATAPQARLTPPRSRCLRNEMRLRVAMYPAIPSSHEAMCPHRGAHRPNQMTSTRGTLERVPPRRARAVAASAPLAGLHPATAHGWSTGDARARSS